MKKMKMSRIHEYRDFQVKKEQIKVKEKKRLHVYRIIFSLLVVYAA